MRNKIIIMKDIKSLDAQIRTIFYPDDKDLNENYYILEVGMRESIGEQGYIETFFYDEYPKEEEIIKDIKTSIKLYLKELENSITSGREEAYIKCFKKLKGGLK